MDMLPLPGTTTSWSRIGLGCWAMGGEYWGHVEDMTSIKAMECAVAKGINWFDTAPLYGKGHTDKLVGQFAKKHAIRIATKVGVRWDQGHARSDLSPEHLRLDVTQSLRRLGVDHIDLLQVHWPCQNHTPLEETFGTLAKMQQEGLFSHLGVCNYTADALAQIHQITPIVSHQSPYSMIRRAYETTLAPHTTALNIANIAYEPLCRGLLTGKYTTRPVFTDPDCAVMTNVFKAPHFRTYSVFNDIRRVAQKVDVPIAAISLGWALQRSEFVLVGAKTPEQVSENVQALNIIHSKTMVDRG